MRCESSDIQAGGLSEAKPCEEEDDSESSDLGGEVVVEREGVDRAV